MTENLIILPKRECFLLIFFYRDRTFLAEVIKEGASITILFEERKLQRFLEEIVG